MRTCKSINNKRLSQWKSSEIQMDQYQQSSHSDSPVCLLTDLLTWFNEIFSVLKVFGRKDLILILVNTNQTTRVCDFRCEERRWSSSNRPGDCKDWEGNNTSAILYLFLTVNFGCHTRSLEDLRGGGGKEECSYRKILSLFISVISWLYDDSVAQNYSNIENMNTSLSTNYRKNILASMKT